jgi:hypothetical protein
LPHKFLALVFFLFTCAAYPQDQDTDSSPYGGRVIINETQETPEDDSSAVDSSAVESSDDAELQELERLKLEHQKKVQKIQESAEVMAKPLGDDPAQQLLKLTKGQLTALSLTDEKVLALVSRLFAEGQLNQGPREETRKFLQEKVKGSWGEKIFELFPSFLEIATDILRDTQAMPGLIKIITRKNDLKNFFYIWLSIVIFGILIKGKVKKMKTSPKSKAIMKMVLNLMLSLSSMAVFYSLFKEELTPSLRIMAQHWF